MLDGRTGGERRGEGNAYLTENWAKKHTLGFNGGGGKEEE